VSFNTLLHGYAQLWVGDGDDRQAAAKVLRERMRDAGVLPNEVTYNALLDLHPNPNPNPNPRTRTLNPTPTLILPPTPTR
tara:strand:+ start:118 stop:357 length:240 start_codon:yes stop_codon:yes gene_type:complete